MSLDIIWLPDPTRHDADRAGERPIPREFELFLLGFTMLGFCVIMAPFLADSHVVALAESVEMDFGINLLTFFPKFGFLTQNMAAVIGTFKSNAPITKRMIWFVATQLVASLLLTLALPQ